MERIVRLPHSLGNISLGGYAGEISYLLPDKRIPPDMLQVFVAY